MGNSRWIKLIHVAKNKVGIDDDAYHAILGSVGVTSSTQITSEAQFNAVMASFKALGFTYDTSKQRTKPRHRITSTGQPGYVTKRQEYYIRGLWDLASRAKDEKSLKGIINRIAKVDDISFLTRSQATAVIQALRDICWKAGINPDRRDNGSAVDSRANG